MVSNDVFSFLKGNVGEEDVIKLLLLSAVKALLSVAIFIGGLMSYVKLCEWVGFGFTTLWVGIFTIIMLFHFSRGISYELMGMESKPISIRKYKTWKYIFEGIQIHKLFYLSLLDVKLDQYQYKNLDYASTKISELYLHSWTKSIISLIFTYGLGLILVYIYASFSVSIFISAPIESYITIGAIAISIISLSYVFLKLKWKKLWLEDGTFNWNLAAWCICASVIITTISFIAGVAIRNLAGIIGVEYTTILVLSYAIITAIYVYIDIKEWIARKAHEARMKIISEEEEEMRKQRQIANDEKERIEKEKKDKLDKLLSRENP